MAPTGATSEVGAYPYALRAREGIQWRAWVWNGANVCTHNRLNSSPEIIPMRPSHQMGSRHTCERASRRVTPGSKAVECLRFAIRNGMRGGEGKAKPVARIAALRVRAAAQPQAVGRAALVVVGALAWQLENAGRGAR